MNKAGEIYFSIIIPTLNEERCLPILLNNLLEQTYQKFDVIVVDGYSNDKTKRKAENFRNKLNINFYQVKKRNVSYQRNFGAKRAESEILIFLDADTILPKDFLKKVSSAFKSESPDLLTTYIKTDERGIKPIETGTNIIFEVTKIIGSPGLYGSMLAVRKSAFNSVHGFNEKLNYKEDAELASKIYKKGFSYIILKNTYYYWSLRRFRKLGMVKTLQKYILLNLNKTLDYQMGGHLFIEEAVERIKKTRNKNFELKFEEFFDSLIEKFRIK